jgi:hypothetical protein
MEELMMESGYTFLEILSERPSEEIERKILLSDGYGSLERLNMMHDRVDHILRCGKHNLLFRFY